MAKKTDMQALKQLAKSLLFFDPVDTEYAPLVIKHPFTDSGIVALPQSDGSLGIGNILENPEDLKAWRKQQAKIIDHRFGENGTVYEAQISKEHVYAYFGGRGESEVIVDPKYLTDITQVEEQGEGFVMNLQ